MNKKFCGHNMPLLVGSIRQRTPDSVIADIKNCESDGANAFILHIQLMEEQYHCYDAFQKIAESTEFPIMAINYITKNGQTDKQRIAVQMEAVNAGFVCVDLRADTFDNDSRSSLVDCEAVFASANPKEVSMNPYAIAKQKESIEIFHEKGAEVLMSAHVHVELSEEQAVSLALEMQSRGADIVKIITGCQSPEHALDMLNTTATLKKTLNLPFVYGCYGPHSKMMRPFSPLFGCMLVFGHHQYSALSNFEKPLLKDMKDFYRIIKWRMFE